MRLVYISSSVIPSKKANLVHVLQQVASIAQEKVNITLSISSNLDEDEIRRISLEEYNSDLTNVKIVSVPRRLSRFVPLQIAIGTIVSIRSAAKSDKVFFYSRNIYASALLLLMNRRVCHEYHYLERGWRRVLERYVINRHKDKAVYISQALKNDMLSRYAPKVDSVSSIILHDAANVCEHSEAAFRLREQLLRNNRYSKIVSYVGSFMPGRGVEIVIKLSRLFPEVLFVLCGDCADDVIAGSAKSNTIFTGQLSNRCALDFIRASDVLLMPYQRTVEVGGSIPSTERWMSPMKMFEYMASGNPIISSDLPVLREVLRDQVNSLLVEPDDIDCWKAALRMLLENSGLARRLGIQAMREQRRYFTWNVRAKRIVELLNA